MTEKKKKEEPNVKLDLLLIGDVSVDIYMRLDPKSATETNGKVCFLHGSKIPVNEMSINYAGNVCHVGVGCQRLGLTSAIYTEVGADDNGKKFIDLFKSEGLITRYCKKNHQQNTNIHTLIWVGQERTIFSYHEKRAYVLDFATIQRPTWIYYSSMAEGFTDFQKTLADFLANNRNIGLVFNPGTFQLKAGAKELQNILQLTDVIFLNRQEAERLTGTENKNLDLHVLHSLVQKHGPKLSVITDGKNGASVLDQKKLHLQPAPPIDFEIKDKTGSGDAYAAGFLAGIFYGKGIKTAMSWGSANAANTLKYVGCLPGLLTKDEITKVA